MRIGALLLLCAPLGVLAQYPFTRTLEVRTGQQRPAITTVTQDALGLLWVGSDLGLFRTDGENVDLILRTEGTAVNALLRDGDAVLAALGNGHVVRCTALGIDTLLSDTLVQRAPVRAMVRDAAGRLWLATYGAGVWVKEGDRVQWITSANGLPDDHVNDLAVLPDGRVVAATDQGLAVCGHRGVAEVFGEAHGAPDNLVLAVAVDSDGNIWAGTDRKGAFRWRPGTDSTAQVLDPQWADGPVVSIAVQDERVWLGTRAHGVVLHDLGPKGGGYRHPAPADGRANAALDLLADAEGAVWWADGSERLHRADPAVLVVPEHEGVDLRHVTALCADADDRIWFATPQGLFAHPAAFSERSFITRTALPLPPNTAIVSLAATDAGTVYAATFGNGLHAVDRTGHVVRYTQGNGLANDNVLAVRWGDERIWCATLDGLDAFRPATQRWEHHAVPGPGFVYDVLPIAGGRAVAATDGNGVLEIGAEGAKALTPGDGPRTFYSVVAVQPDRIWAAGPGTGLCRAGGATPSCAGADRPPFDGDLFAVATALGRILAFGNTGTSAYDPVTGSWTDLTGRFGLEGIQAELNAVCTGRDGTIWLACDKGLVRIRPTEHHFDPAIRTVITGVELGNQPVSAQGVVRVPHDRNDLTIRFTGVHYADPGAVRFEHRLLGHDDRPVRTRDRRMSWAGLPAGSYTFQVRAFTADALGHGEEHVVPDDWTTLQVIIEPPWWRLPWVIAAGVAAVVLAIFLLVRMRDRRLRYRERMEQEKVRFQLEALRSQVDPHFLFNSFNTLVELIESDTGKAVEHVDQLSTFFRNILQVRDKELISVDEELDLLQTYFALEQRRFGERITLHIDVSEEARHRCIVPLTTQLLVENALKHNAITAQHPLTISLTAKGDDLVVRNRINARISTPRSTGFGLESIRKRYMALTERPVVVAQREGDFEVRIPLVQRKP